MTDRALLEAAAKAAGLQIDFWFAGEDGADEASVVGQARAWNPLTDDGDALRLAVKLRMEIAPIEGGGVDVILWRDGAMFGEIISECAADPYAATRRAIVRAAAAIGGAK